MKALLNKKTLVGNVSALGLLALSTSQAFAINLPDGSSVDLSKNFGNFGTLGDAVGTLISWILMIAGLAAFLYILWGAFNYVTAGDDSGKTEKARKTITNAVVGLILVALTFVIWQVAVSVTGVDFGNL